MKIDELHFKNLLERQLSGIFEPTASQVAKLWNHYQTLVRWNKVLNLTAIPQMELAVPRHYCESIYAALQLPSGHLSIADIGSGAGFPGIPAAIVRPDCRFTLIESHQRKAAFLKECSRGLPNVSVAPVRAENFAERFDWLISRAVSPERVIALVPQVAERILLLTGARSAALIRRHAHLDWSPPVPIPWTRSSMVVIGRCVRRFT